MVLIYILSFFFLYTGLAIIDGWLKFSETENTRIYKPLSSLLSEPLTQMLFETHIICGTLLKLCRYLIFDERKMPSLLLYVLSL